MLLRHENIQQAISQSFKKPVQDLGADAPET